VRRSRGAPRGTESLLIQVEHLTKCYGPVRAVDDVSFTVGRGEVAALLGPNGSGKSTLMRCLIGFFSPTAGTVRVGGVDVGERPVAARREVGYLPEQIMLYPELTVRRYLRFVAGMKGLDARAARRAVDDAIVRCGLGSMAQRLTGKLSKGYRQRVGLAQALLGNPAVLVLDEPTVGLDPVQTVEMRDLLRTLDGCTVLLSTHILAEAAALCTRIVILADGHLVAEDTPAGLAARVGGAERVVVRVEGPASEVQTALAGLPGVLGVEEGSAGGEAGRVFVIRAQQAEPVQRAVAGLVVGNGWTLLEVRTVAPTLEDLFVRAVH
jgi:gliding motility-associated transport system ATP-binding protein